MPQRRQVLILATTAGLALTQSACGQSPVVHTFADLATARAVLEAIAKTPDAWHASGAFSLGQTLEHLAQSVEYSLRGFPQAKSALFQSTLGKAALAVFDSRGRMSHGLDEPIPGAPALSHTAQTEAGAQRLLAALAAFDAHAGELKPHFAYGSLSKSQYLRAHLMHMANHWSEVVQGARPQAPKA